MDKQWFRQIVISALVLVLNLSYVHSQFRIEAIISTDFPSELCRRCPERIELDLDKQTICYCGFTQNAVPLWNCIWGDGRLTTSDIDIILDTIKNATILAKRTSDKREEYQKQGQRLGSKAAEYGQEGQQMGSNVAQGNGDVNRRGNNGDGTASEGNADGRVRAGGNARYEGGGSGGRAQGKPEGNKGPKYEASAKANSGQRNEARGNARYEGNTRGDTRKQRDEDTRGDAEVQWGGAPRGEVRVEANTEQTEEPCDDCDDASANFDANVEERDDEAQANVNVGFSENDVDYGNAQNERNQGDYGASVEVGWSPNPDSTTDENGYGVEADLSPTSNVDENYDESENNYQINAKYEGQDETEAESPNKGLRVEFQINRDRGWLTSKSDKGTNSAKDNVSRPRKNPPVRNNSEDANTQNNSSARKRSDTENVGMDIQKPDLGRSKGRGRTREEDERSGKGNIEDQSRPSANRNNGELGKSGRPQNIGNKNTHDSVKESHKVKAKPVIVENGPNSRVADTISDKVSGGRGSIAEGAPISSRMGEKSRSAAQREVGSQRDDRKRVSKLKNAIGKVEKGKNLRLGKN